jgi:hypothetical protein
MAEYMIKAVLSAAGSVDVGIPTNGAVLAVYSTSAVKLEWVFNGDVGQLAPAGSLVWEPHNPFAPGPFSALRITSTAAAEITMMMV